MKMTPYISKENYVRIVKNAFRNAKPIKFENKILAPQIQVKLKNLLKLPPNSLTFKYEGKNTAALRKKPKYLTASVSNELMRQHRRRVISGNSSNENNNQVKRPRH
jgi:hypothetical protein